MSDEVFKPDVTVATVIPDGNRYLLVEELVGGVAVFNQPAGHLDRGESLVDAAVRETFEETGYQVELTGVVGVYQWTDAEQRHFLRTTFCGKVVQHDPNAPLDTGILATHWLTSEEIEVMNGRLRSPMVALNVTDFERGRQYPLNMIQTLLP